MQFFEMRIVINFADFELIMIIINLYRSLDVFQVGPQILNTKACILIRYKPFSFYGYTTGIHFLKNPSLILNQNYRNKFFLRKNAISDEM